MTREYRPRLTTESIKSKVYVNSDGCWIWTKAKKNPGNRSFAYGWVTYRKKQMSAHRASWIIRKGDIPEGMFVCHSCDVPLCVNPDHLFLGTHSDNMLDMWRKKRHSPPTDGCVGSRSSKLTIEQVAEIRDLLAKGTKQREIAFRYNVVQSTVSLIATGKSWGRYA